MLALSWAAGYFGLNGSVFVFKRMYPPLPANADSFAEPPAAAPPLPVSVESGVLPNNEHLPEREQARVLGLSETAATKTLASIRIAKFVLFVCFLVAAHGLILCMTYTAPSPPAMSLLHASMSDLIVVAISDLIFGGFLYALFTSAGTPEMMLAYRRLATQAKSPIVLAFKVLGVLCGMGALIAIISSTQPRSAPEYLNPLRLEIGLPLLLASLCGAVVAYQRLFPPLTPELADKTDEEQNAVLLTTVRRGIVPNSYLTRQSDRNLVFRAPGSQKRVYKGLGLVLLILMTLLIVLSVQLHAMHHLNPHSALPLSAFIAISTTIFTLMLLPPIRSLSQNRLEFDTVARAYFQRSSEGVGWKKARQADTSFRWKARVYDGLIDRDLSGVGLRVTSRTTNYKTILLFQVMAAWRDDNHPGAPLSNIYNSATYANAAMQEIAALLGVPALGELDIL